MTAKEFAKKIIASINPGTADISGIGDGTIKGAVNELNSKINESLNGQNKKSFKLLWENSNPNSQFEPQNVSLDLSDVNVIFIKYQLAYTEWGTVNNKYAVVEYIKGEEISTYLGLYDSYAIWRKVTSNDNSIQFDAAYYAGSNNSEIKDNRVLVPVKIWAQG